ncbi:MAG: hypothetical protein [Olavius algarvensis Delta 4 endosymbiont]|nr:MAG: hypothetical protein [Olavius algarvensis Delta 4 endosymbiont]
MPGESRFGPWSAGSARPLPGIGHILEIAKNVLVFTTGVW